MTAPTSSVTSRAIAVVYLSALLQGLALVSFAASAPLLKNLKAFTDSQYGFLFIPQVITTILGSVFGGGLAGRFGLQTLLFVALIANGVSQLGLAIAVEYLGPGHSYAMSLVSAALLGVGFGIGAAPLNTYPGLMFPERRDSAIVALHTLIGGGMAAGPAIAGWLMVRNEWIGYPALMVAMAAVLAVMSLGSGFPKYGGAPATTGGPQQPSSGNVLASPLLWMFCAIAAVYAVAEGTFANWSVVYLHEERGFHITHASMALAVFWAVMSGGRLLFSVLLLKIPARAVWVALPVFIAVAFLLMPYAHTPAAGIGLFAFAGIACSAFLPITIGIVSARFPAAAAFVSSLMIASLMFGVGVGTFVVGSMRSLFSLERLYQLSAVYPTVVLLLVLIVLATAGKRAQSSADAGKS